MSAAPESTPQQPKETTQSAAPTEAAPAATDQYQLDKGELMRQFVQTADQNEAFKKELDTLKQALADKDAELKARVEAEMAAEKAENVAKAEAMLKAYEATLSKEELTTGHRDAIMHLASAYPKETKALFEVSCLASKKAAAQVEAVKDSEQRVLEKRVVDVISKKRGAAEPAVQVAVHAASKKARHNPFGRVGTKVSASSSSSFKDDNVELFKALTRIQGSAHANLERIAKYQSDIRM